MISTRHDTSHLEGTMEESATLASEGGSLRFDFDHMSRFSLSLGSSSLTASLLIDLSCRRFLSSFVFMTSSLLFT